MRNIFLFHTPGTFRCFFYILTFAAAAAAAAAIAAICLLSPVNTNLQIFITDILLYSYNIICDHGVVRYLSKVNGMVFNII